MLSDSGRLVKLIFGIDRLFCFHPTSQALAVVSNLVVNANSLILFYSCFNDASKNKHDFFFSS